MCITKLDVMDGMETVRICVAYELDGKEVTTPPVGADRFEGCRPIFIELPGWSESTVGAQSYDDLPKNAKAYLRKVVGIMSADDEAGKQARTTMGTASGTDLAGYEAQLASTKMFYTPAEALELTNSEQLKTTMKQVAEFSFEHGLLGEGAPDAGFIGVLTPSGIYGSETNVKLRFDPSYMQMAADGAL